MEFRGPCCGGSHFWGHGNGFDNGKGGKFYKCDGCKKPLVYLEPVEQEKRRERCVHCLALPLIAQGIDRDEARSLAEAGLAALDAA